MALTKIIELITDVVEAHKRVSVDRKTIKEYVTKIMLYIIHFNTLKEHDTWMLDRNIDEIEIPKEFVDFLLPSSVRYIDDELYPDLLARGEKTFLREAELEDVKVFKGEVGSVEEIAIIDETALAAEEDREPKYVSDRQEKLFGKFAQDYNDYRNCVLKLYNLMKITPNFVSLKSIRKCVLLSDVIERVPVKKKLYATGQPVIPLRLNFPVERLIGTDQPTVYVDKVVKKYILGMFDGV